MGSCAGRLETEPIIRQTTGSTLQTFFEGVERDTIKLVIHREFYGRGAVASEVGESGLKVSFCFRIFKVFGKQEMFTRRACYYKIQKYSIK